jgi:hypothetical protein
MKLEFYRPVVDKYSNIKFNKNLPVGAELFHADGRTDEQADKNKLIVAFLNFSKASHKQNKNFQQARN